MGVSNALTTNRTQNEYTRTFTCNKDAYVDSSNPTSNYANADLEVSNSSYRARRSYLSFEIQDLPSDADIKEVTFGLSVKFLPYDDHTVPLDIWKTTYFDEDIVTWENCPQRTVLMIQVDIAENKRWSIPLENHGITGNLNLYICLSTDLDNSAPITFDSRDDMWNPPRVAVTFEALSIDESPNGTVDLVIFLILLGPIGGIGLAIFLMVRKSNKRKTSFSIVYQEPRISQKSVTIDQFCGQCGAPLDSTNVFCPSCGKKQ